MVVDHILHDKNALSNIGFNLPVHENEADKTSTEWAQILWDLEELSFTVFHRDSNEVYKGNLDTENHESWLQSHKDLLLIKFLLFKCINIKSFQSQTVGIISKSEFFLTLFLDLSIFLCNFSF